MILHKACLRSFSKSSQMRCSNKIKDLLDNAASGDDATPQSQADRWSTSPYPEGAVFSARERDQSKKARRSLKDPKYTSIMMFPGQGAQKVGMGRNLLKIPEAMDMYKTASEVLGYDLLRLCLDGPQKKLDQTRYAQPAIAVTSLASLEKLQEERPQAIESCVGAAGFSLGEISALIFAGSIPFDQGIKLIQIRAEAMQAASEEFPSGMATVYYGPDSEVGKACLAAKEWCLEKGVDNPECAVANFLYPHCKVVAGSLEALKFLETYGKQFKLRKVKRLPVSGGFHTNLMESAVEPFKNALKKIQIEPPMIRVHSNIDGKIYRNADHIIRQLPKQIVKPVKWEQLLHIVYERKQGMDFPRTFELAPGTSLSVILKAVNARAHEHSYSVDNLSEENLKMNDRQAERND